MTAWRGLTLWEPWATLWASGEKVFETRSWSTEYRGVLVVHAAKTFRTDQRRLCEEEPFRSSMLQAKRMMYGAGDDPYPKHFGCILGAGLLADVNRITTDSRELKMFIHGWKEIEFGDWTPGRVAWGPLVHRVVLPDPIPWRGRQGTWEVPDDLRERILKATRYQQASKVLASR